MWNIDDDYDDDGDDDGDDDDDDDDDAQYRQLVVWHSIVSW